MDDKRMRLPLTIAAIAVAVKVVGVILIRLGRPSGFANLVIVRDWGPLVLTRAICDALFDPGRIGASAAEAFLFDGLLAITTFIQWYAAAWLISRVFFAVRARAED